MSLYSRSNVNHVIREHSAVLSVGILKPNSKLFVVTVIDLQILMLAFPRGITPCQKDQILKNIEQYLIGDMNYNLLSSVNTSSKTLLNVADNYDLTQLINDSTQITTSTNTLTDLIFTNHRDNIFCSGLSHVSVSDHSLV